MAKFLLSGSRPNIHTGLYVAVQGRRRRGLQFVWSLSGPTTQCWLSRRSAWSAPNCCTQSICSSTSWKTSTAIPQRYVFGGLHVVIALRGFHQFAPVYSSTAMRSFWTRLYVIYRVEHMSISQHQVLESVTLPATARFGAWLAMQLPYTTERILSGKISYLIEYAAPYMSGYHRIVVAKAYHITSPVLARST